MINFRGETENVVEVYRRIEIQSNILNLNKGILKLKGLSNLY